MSSSALPLFPALISHHGSPCLSRHMLPLLYHFKKLKSAARKCVCARARVLLSHSNREWMFLSAGRTAWRVSPRVKGHPASNIKFENDTLLVLWLYRKYKIAILLMSELHFSLQVITFLQLPAAVVSRWRLQMLKVSWFSFYFVDICVVSLKQ